jgi:hypothetical protein
MIKLSGIKGSWHKSNNSSPWLKENLPPEIVADISALTGEHLYVFVSSQYKIHFFPQTLCQYGPETGEENMSIVSQFNQSQFNKTYFPFQEDCLLGCDSVLSGGKLTQISWNIPPPSSKRASSDFCFLGLIFGFEDKSNSLFGNIIPVYTASYTKR